MERLFSHCFGLYGVERAQRELKVGGSIVELSPNVKKVKKKNTREEKEEKNTGVSNQKCWCVCD